MLTITAIVTFDTELTYEKDNWELFAGIYNISNETYQRPNGYSQLGRNAMMGFRRYF